MEKEFFIGKMEENTMAIGKMILKMEREYFIKLMEINMMVNGKMI